MTTNWNPIDEPIDTVLIAGEKTPGIAEIEDAGSPRDWDERRGRGLSGASLVYGGLPLAPFKILLRLYTVRDWAAWHAFAPRVQRPPTGERGQALDITHPILEEVGITSFVVTNLLAPKQTRDGEWTIEIQCQEYRAPAPALTTIDSSSDSTTQEPLSAFQLESASLDAQIQAEARAGGLL